MPKRIRKDTSIDSRESYWTISGVTCESCFGLGKRMTRMRN